MLTVYSTKICPWCIQVERLLKLKNVPYKKVFIDDDMEMREKLFKITGMMTVPVTTDGKDYVVGWNMGALMKLIKADFGLL